MDQDKVEYLFQRFIDKTITEEEQRDLLKLIERNEDEKLFGFLSEIIDASGEEKIGLEDWTALLSTSISADKPVTKVRRMKFFYRYVSAAAVILLIGSAVFFYKNSAVKPESQITSVIKPGENKAVLIMEDGNSIMLDEDLKASEVLAKDSSIKSVSNGEIVYSNNLENTKASGHNVLRTPKGGQYRIVLPDGTIAWLNADSELKFPSAFDQNMRKVELEGEAYFEVVSYNKKWPFIVKSLGQKIEVLGTKFNVSAYQDDGFIKTSLLEGKVKIINETSQKTVTLKPGQEATLSKNLNQIKVYASEVEESIAWKEGLFVFNSEDVYVAMNKISRWYDVDVTYKGDFRAKALWGTASRSEKLESLLKTLQATGVARFRIEGRRILVMP